VQTWWDTFNPAARNLTVVANDPYLRRVYVLAACSTSAVVSDCYMMDYRELNTAGAMSSSGPLKVSYTGRMLTTDLTRKWSPWSVVANHCSMIGDGDSAVMTFCGGGNQALGATYTLGEGSLIGLDDDYGAFESFYSSYYLLSADEAQQLKLSPHRKSFRFLTLNVSGLGQVVVTPYLNQSIVWRSTRPVPLPVVGRFDLQFPLNVSADRASFQIAAQRSPAPAVGPANLQAGFRLSAITVALTDHAMSIVRGSNL
jgi:hypothetical protein